MRIQTAFLGGLLLVSVGCKKKEESSAPASSSSSTATTSAATSSATSESSAAASSAKPDIHHEIVKYKSGSTELQGYIAYDKNIKGKRPGVLVVHEWWGHTDYVRDRAKQLAGMGYTAFALDMYGDGKKAEHPKEAMEFSAAATKDMEESGQRFNAARTILATHETTDESKIAAIGYCFGGGIVLHMARAGADLDAVVSFHGALAPKKTEGEPMLASKETKARVLVLHGEADPLVKPEDVEGIKKEMKDAGVDFKFVGYPGAKHAFTNPEATEKGKKFELPLAYDEAADKKSWQEMSAFLKQTFAQTK